MTVAQLHPLALEIDDLVRRFEGRVAWIFEGLEGAVPEAQVRLSQRSDEPFKSASLIKLPILAATLDAAERGHVDLNARLVVDRDDLVGGSGVLHHLAPGLAPTLLDLLTLMIVQSDNTATNVVLDHVGEDAVRRWIHANGMARTDLVGKLQLPPERWNERQRAGARNATTAEDVSGLWTRLHRGELLPPKATTTMLEITSRQMLLEGIGRRLPYDRVVPDARGRTVRIDAKSGCLPGLWHDSGIVSSGDGTPLFQLTVLTDGSPDEAEHLQHPGLLLIGHVARRAFLHAVGAPHEA